MGWHWVWELLSYSSRSYILKGSQTVDKTLKSEGITNAGRLDIQNSGNRDTCSRSQPVADPVGREEQAMMTNLAGLIVVLMILLQEIKKLFDMVKSLFGF